MTQPKKNRGRPKKIQFEDQYDLVYQSVSKRKHKWFLKTFNSLDWEDVKFIIIHHIYKKWNLWDQKRPLEPWLNRIISNQIKNLLRNNYGNFARPCVSCPFNTSGTVDYDIDNNNSCEWTKTKKQDCSCPLFKKWSKTKKHSFNLNTASSIDAADFPMQCTQNFDIELASNKLHTLMKIKLSEKQYRIYKMLFIDKLDPKDVAVELGYKSNEKGRSAGYKQIKNFEKTFKVLAKKIIKNNDII